VIEPRAKELNAPLYRVEGGFWDYDEENSAIARRALELLQKDWKGLEIDTVSQYRPPCRFEDVPQDRLRGAPRIILDVAHNPDGIDKLLCKLGKGKAIFLCSISQDKDIPTMLASLLHDAAGLICTQALSKRAIKSERLGKIALDLKPSCPVRIEAQVDRAVALGIDMALEKSVPLVITGTFYLMDQVKRILWSR
jgi:dihydrofolate synthase/folylpolyglutamate synthase